MLVFGTRPEAIKMAPLVKEFQKQKNHFETIVCVTGQHREMLDQVLNLFDIKPDFDLNIMKQGQDLYDITSRVLIGMRSVILESQPDIVLVHGDTTTSTASALAAFYQKIPVGHIEAGLRTHNIYSPWPEEMNRQITSRIATYNYAPTPLSKQNLIEENVPIESIIVTGNTVIDALYWVIAKMENDKPLKKNITKQLINFKLPKVKLKEWNNQYKLKSIEARKTESVSSFHHTINLSRKLVLITGHRRENFGQGFQNICIAIKELSETFPLVDFVYPMHLNPNVRNAIKLVFGGFSENQCNSNVRFIEPLDYLPFIYLMNISYLVLTDSGGIQEEAPGLGKPVLVMRDTTERPEALVAGTVKLVGTQKDKIISEVSKLINNENYYKSMSKALNPYGDGKACLRIVNSLI